MNLPFFFVPALQDASLVLDEDTSKHVIQVLRKKVGDQILLTDGKGTKAVAEISDDHRKHCRVQIITSTNEPAKERQVCIAISLVKNASRFEWFLEKATEIGVAEIIPMLCERTEKEKFRYERMQHILISAMLQSQQSWLPVLHEPAELKKVIQVNKYDRKFIAHCLPEGRSSLQQHLQPSSSSLILIGPEGDFTEDEITSALQHQFLPVSLGDTRLRTETAGLVASTLLCLAVEVDGQRLTVNR